MPRQIVFVFASCLFVVGCSSSDSGVGGPVASPGPTVAITSNNAVEVAGISWSAALDSGEFADLSGTGLFISATPGSISRLDGPIAQSAKSAGAGSGQSRVPIPEETIPCDVSGDVTVSGQIADPITPTLTAGDFFIVDYNVCDDGFGDVTDGLLRMDIDAFSGDFLNDSFDMTVTLTLNTLQVSSGQDVITSHGDVTATIDTVSQSSLFTAISGNSMRVDTNAGSETLTNFASSLNVNGAVQPPSYARSASGTLDSTELAGVIRYSTPLTFEGLGVDFPSTGEFLVEGDKSSLRLVAVNNVDVRIELDTDGDGNVDQTILTTWAELVAEGAPAG